MGIWKINNEQDYRMKLMLCTRIVYVLLTCSRLFQSLHIIRVRALFLCCILHNLAYFLGIRQWIRRLPIESLF